MCNLNTILHLPKCVVDLGPFWAYSNLPFENNNGKWQRFAPKSPKEVLSHKKNQKMLTYHNSQPIITPSSQHLFAVESFSLSLKKCKHIDFPSHPFSIQHAREIVKIKSPPARTCAYQNFQK